MTRNPWEQELVNKNQGVCLIRDIPDLEWNKLKDLKDGDVSISASFSVAERVDPKTYFKAGQRLKIIRGTIDREETIETRIINVEYLGPFIDKSAGNHYYKFILSAIRP